MFNPFKKLEQWLRSSKRIQKLEAKVQEQSQIILELQNGTHASILSLLEGHQSVSLDQDAIFCQSGFYAKPAQKNVLFLNNSYYHFNYLAQALRKRGWDAVLVSTHPPRSDYSLYYHGEDINLFAEDPTIFNNNLQRFYEMAKGRFDLLHFANDYVMSFFPYYYPEPAPPDIVEWKSMGKKLAYTVSGCNSGISKSTLGQWTEACHGYNACNYCKWQEVPEVCNDNKSLAWGNKVHQYCDIIFAEGLPQLDYMRGPKVVSEFTTMCLDPLVWFPELEIPETQRLEKAPNEILIYHAVGNLELRTRQDGKNFKGTWAVLEAIDRLKDEGYPVRLVFVTDKPNKDVRYTQVQCDIIVDQLIFGRYGATAREGLMLGKPVVSLVNPTELDGQMPLSSLLECPIVSASETTLYDILKDLVCSSEKRHQLGHHSRKFALKWHGSDGAAERYEQLMHQLSTSANASLVYPTHWHYMDPIYTASSTPIYFDTGLTSLEASAK